MSSKSGVSASTAGFWSVVCAAALALAYGLVTATAAAQEGTGTEVGTGASTATDGGALYLAECARCHGDTGQADTRIGQRFNTPPFTAELLNGLGAEGVRAAIVEGRENMPPEEELTPEQIEAVVAHTLSLAQ